VREGTGGGVKIARKGEGSADLHMSEEERGEYVKRLAIQARVEKKNREEKETRHKRGKKDSTWGTSVVDHSQR